MPEVGHRVGPAAVAADPHDRDCVLVETDYADACPIATVALEVASTNETLRQATAEVFTDWIEVGGRHLEQRGVPPEAARGLIIGFITSLEVGGVGGAGDGEHVRALVEGPGEINETILIDRRAAILAGDRRLGERSFSIVTQAEVVQGVTSPRPGSRLAYAPGSSGSSDRSGQRCPDPDAAVSFSGVAR